VMKNFVLYSICSSGVKVYFLTTTSILLGLAYLLSFVLNLLYSNSGGL
jgi:hypothetical protein